MKKNFYITTPIYYVNSEPHIGSVYTTLMADIIARFKKLNGLNVRFLTGTDEHGQKIQQSAEKNHISEQDFVDKMSKTFKNVDDYMNFEYDDFIRTTEKRHKDFVQDIWRKLVKNGWIYKGKYNGWYCVSDEAYYTEDDLIKQEDGSFRTTLGKSVEWREEDSYFFKLSLFQKILLDVYKNTDFIKPESRKNEIISFVKGGKENIIEGFLKDLSISRNNFSWGIKIPCDDKCNNLIDKNGNWIENINENEKHVIYVWLDALFNYQSALNSYNKFDEFWNNANIVHFVGKDIIRFHTVYWPAFLIAVNYNDVSNLTYKDVINLLPTNVFAHGWWTNEGKKISKSLGNAISVDSEINWLVNNFNLDENIAKDYFKYYLSTETSFGSDGDYSRSRLIKRINSELVNNIGNLIQRVLSMIYKDCDGFIDCREFIDIYNLKEELEEKTINIFDFQSYKDLILKISNDANDYMEKTTPWNLKKNGDINSLKNVLYYEVENIRKIVILLQPLCPYISKNIINFLNINKYNFECLYNSDNLIKTKIDKPFGFFPRLLEK